ncbi:MAG: VWA domain-containing protein [Terriglobales bacterium]
MKRKLLVLDQSGSLALKAGDDVVPIPPPRDTIAILVDTSGSMAGQKIEQVKAGATQFASAAAVQGFRTGVLIFGDRAGVVLSPTSDLMSIRRKLAALRVGFVGGSTNLTAGLQVCQKLPQLHTAVVVSQHPASSAELEQRPAHQRRAGYAPGQPAPRRQSPVISAWLSQYRTTSALGW